MYQFLKTTFVTLDFVICCHNTLQVVENVAYCFLSNKVVSLACSSFLSCSYAWILDTTLSNSWYDFPNGLCVLTRFIIVMNCLAIFSHFVRNLVCSMFIFCNCSFLFSLWIIVSLLIASTNRYSSSSLAFCVSIVFVDPNSSRWITDGISC